MRTEEPIGNWPCSKPPWARLVAINANTGDIAWQAPLGVNETMPAGKQNVGSPGAGGPIVTAGGVLFIGATNDGRFRAFESKTGKELWSTKLDYNITAIPMTYLGKNGKQYVGVVAGAGGARGAKQRVVGRVRVALKGNGKPDRYVQEFLISCESAMHLSSQAPL